MISPHSSLWIYNQARVDIDEPVKLQTLISFKKDSRCRITYVGSDIDILNLKVGAAVIYDLEIEPVEGESAI